jgi:signal transduction histidine kinase
MLTAAMKLTRQSDLETVLAAWQAATVRLERTHEALRGEVQRLTDELAVKNRELARKNRLADLGQMAAHVAHEVRNNLVPVTLYLSVLRRRISRPGSLAVLEKVRLDLLPWTPQSTICCNSPRTATRTRKRSACSDDRWTVCPLAPQFHQ